MAKSKKPKASSNTIVLNKKARHDYFIEQTLEAGLSLEGWEVKSLRENKVQIKESYVILKNSEMFLFGAHISALQSTSTHVTADATRTRKLLLNRLEINRLKGDGNSDDTYQAYFDKPAFARRNKDINSSASSEESNLSRYNLNDDDEIVGNNRFFDDNVD